MVRWTPAHDLWHGVMDTEFNKGRPPPVEKKLFVPKVDLPTLRSYRKPASSAFWERFPRNMVWPGKSPINPDALEALGRSLGLWDDRFEQVVHDIRFGAVLGCRGEARLPTVSKNAASAYQFGRQVTDAIADWIKKGYAYGPVRKEELPKQAKVAGIMCAEKPNGSVRVILNLSAPKGSSVNSGIDKLEFPAVMSSTLKWLAILNKAGRGCKMVKIDWASAYKQIPVCRGDLNLQWFSWLGRYFCELSLIFGGVSSVGIFDRAAKVVNQVVQTAAGMPPELVAQHLDDTCAAGPADSDVVERFDDAFFRIAESLGLELASREDPEKSFGPSTSGVVLGVLYNTVDWTWAIPQPRLDNILWLIWDALECKKIPAKAMESLAGKLIHVRALVPDSRFYLSEIQAAVSYIRREESWQEASGCSSPIFVARSEALTNQLHYWRTLLPSCSGRIPIPSLSSCVPPGALEFFTDAAGGSFCEKWHGLGAVGPGCWAFMPWPRSFHDGKRCADGKQLGRKLTFLEILGPLLVVACAPRICAGKDVRVWVDNAGAVQIYKKGYSPTCFLSTCVAKAIHVVASALGCRVFVEKVTRCSTVGAEAADALSKADFARFLAYWEGPLPEACRPPRALLAWLLEPDCSCPLGNLILEEIAQ